MTNIALALFALMMAIISLWVKRSPWIWGPFLIIAGTLGHFAGNLEPIALAPALALFVLHLILRGPVSGLARFILVLLAAAIGFALWFHLLPGFHNWTLNGISFELDRPLAGFFALAFATNLLQSPGAFKNLMKVALPLSIVGVAVLVLMGIYFETIHFSPKWQPNIWLFIPGTLILSIIPLEGFLRSFLQTECFNFFGGKGFFANLIAPLFIAALFTAIQYKWITDPLHLMAIFVSGIVYGCIYQYTKAVEASITCHLLFSVALYCFFG